jgi:hypothetical protein
MYRHDVALEHAQSAIFHAQEESVRCEMHEDKTQSGGDVLDAKSQQEKIVALAIAYHIWPSSSSSTTVVTLAWRYS